MPADTRAAEAALDDLAAAVRDHATRRPLRPAADTIRRGGRIRRRRQGAQAVAVAAVVMTTGAGAWGLRSGDERPTGLQVGASTPALAPAADPSSSAVAGPDSPVTTDPPTTASPATTVPSTTTATTVPPPDGASFIAPVAAPMSGGYRVGGARSHLGADFAAPVGTPVVAARAGRIVRAGADTTGYGNLVVIDHGDGLSTYYAHLSGIRVRADQIVARGEPIGAVGLTGQTTTAQLHFEVRRDGQAVDPAAYLPTS